MALAVYVRPGSSVLGVHVRRGDKYDNHQDVSVFEKYFLPKIMEIARKHRLGDVFVGGSDLWLGCLFSVLWLMCAAECVLS